LLHPSGRLRLVELVLLVDVEVAGVPVHAGAGLRVQFCRFTISLIQIGANGDVQPFEHG
jgi:hypothetical protein